MENILLLMAFIALVGIVVGLILAVIKKVRRKPAKKSLGLAGVSFAVFIAASVAMPEPSVEQQIGGPPLYGTYVSTTQNRELVFDGKTAALYENGEQIQTGTYEYYGERSINIVYEDYAELLIYTSDAKEILYQGNGNARNLGEAEYVKEGIDNPDLTALDIDYPPNSIYYKGAEEQAAVVSDHVTENPSRNEPAESESLPSETEQGMRHGDDAEYIGADMWLKDNTDFSEGRAWIQFRESDRKKGSVDAATEAAEAALGDDTDRLLYGLQNWNSQGNNRAALIDTQGKILWESDLTSNDFVLSHKSEFRDGLAYCVYNGNDGKSSYIILDSDGNATFTRDCEEDYRIIGHGGGLFLAAEHIANFDSNEWKIGAIDKNGNIVVPFKAYENHIDSTQMMSFDDYGNKFISCDYLGENIYNLSFLDGYVLLNIKDQSVIYTYRNGNGNYIREFLSDFENGAATVLYEEGMAESVCSLGTDGTLTQITSNDWIQYRYNGDMEFSEGLAFAKDGSAGAYYNIIGEKVIDFPQFHDKNYYDCDPFYSGYAAMGITGADGLYYITAINKNGDLMFEPKPGFDAVYTSNDGKYVTAVTNGSITVFDINGNPLVDINYIRIIPQQGYDVYEYNVCDGVIKIKDFYVNVEDGTVIGLHGDGDSDFSVTVY